MNIEFTTFLDGLASIIDVRAEEDKFEELEATEEELREKFPEGSILTPTDLYDEMSKYEQVEKLRGPDPRIQAIADVMEANRQRKEIAKTLGIVDGNVEDALDLLTPTDDANDILNKDKKEAEKTRKRGPA